MTITEVGDEIIAALDKAIAKISDPEWTNKIKLVLGEIGMNYGYEVRASTIGKDFHGEWLYDIVWCKKDGEYLKEIYLVCESELNASSYQLAAIRYDFEKLLLSHAPLKIMITQTYKTERVELIKSQCKEGIQRYEGMKKGDRILLINYDDNELGLEGHWIEKE